MPPYIAIWQYSEVGLICQLGNLSRIWVLREWVLAAGYWILDTRCWMLDAGYNGSAFGAWLTAQGARQKKRPV